MTTSLSTWAKSTILTRSTLCNVPFCCRVDAFVQTFTWETQLADINSRSDVCFLWCLHTCVLGSENKGNQASVLLWVRLPTSAPWTEPDRLRAPDGETEKENT